ncbi:3-phosphoglycerate kinase [Pseudomonas sp. 10B1]|uniref:3-phosphoglycerate kinase n=1 Tax=unclassified Pseudomonas TaxID=196821 RepID=UPI002AB48A48|nr:MULTISPECIES: 3-phosphoglycerate kinase [unclassified Pseudomonas]MDY7561538.1 3-phosphoglycerate kinase [Pseudomonas sp. AB6]MEA9979159.1 3-phosphoglycerate kinase [Pseudomonas sp. RTS4]MEA9994978.1 3-phosphoglycerate kinase [Pseudomonas sp. AA4]MEB0088202.1 3-phosphoglycerate kinase [Pseudomonas sp. RTI1]MEB0127076.1 3-phosphoglycerate kinase [Pseudomonas sp. CCC1.2]
MKKFCCVLLALLPITAFAYPIDVEKHLTGVSIDYTSYDTDYNLGSIKLNNYGDNAAECTVVFINGPESPRTRRVQLPAKASVDASAKFTRSIIKLRINLTCVAK